MEQPSIKIFSKKANAWNYFNPSSITLTPRQNGRHFVDGICGILIQISMKFVPQGPINNNPLLVPIVAWRRRNDKPLSEPMTAYRCYANSRRKENYKGRYDFFFKTTLTNAYVECIWADQTTFFERADAISQNFAAFHVLKLSSGKSRSSESRGCCSVCHILFSVCQNYGCCHYSVASFTDIYYVDQHWG